MTKSRQRFDAALEAPHGRRRDAAAPCDPATVAAHRRPNPPTPGRKTYPVGYNIEELGTFRRM